MANTDVGLRFIVLGMREARQSIGNITSDMSRLEKQIRTTSLSAMTLGESLTSWGKSLAGVGRSLSLAFTLPAALIGGGLLNAGMQTEEAFAGVVKTVEGLATGFQDVIEQSPVLFAGFQKFMLQLRETQPSIQYDEGMALYIGQLPEAARNAIFASEAFGQLTKEGLEVREGLFKLGETIPLPITELMRIAEVAGQLGVPADQIVAFTEVAAMMGIATNVSADDAATALGRISNIFNVADEDIVEWSIGVSSAIVDVGNKTAATEGEIISIFMRMAAAGNIAGMTEAELIGIAATMQEIGIKSERGGTAFTRIIEEMLLAVANGGPALDAFAETTGLTAEEFTKMFENNPAELFKVFTKGLADNAEALDLEKEKLKLMGLGGIRAFEAVLLLGTADETLAKNITLSNEAFIKRIALEEEFEKKTKTTISKLQFLKNAFTTLGKTIFLLYKDKIDKLIDGFTKLINKLIVAPPFLQKVVVGFTLIMAAIGPLIIMLALFMQSFGIVLTAFSKMVPLATILKGAFSLLTGSLLPLLVITGLLYVAWQKNFLGIQAYARLLYRTFVGSPVLSALKEMITYLGRGDFDKAGERLQYAFDSFLLWLQNNAIPIIKNWALNAGITIANFIGDGLVSVQTAATNLATWVNDTIVVPIVTEISAIDWNKKFEDAKGFAQSIIDSTKDKVADVVDWADKTLVQPIITEITAVDWSGHFESAKGFAQSILDSTIDKVADATTWVKTTIVEAIKTALQAISWATEFAVDTTTNIADSIITGFPAAIDAAAYWVENSVVTPIITAIQNIDWAKHIPQIKAAISKLLFFLFSPIVLLPIAYPGITNWILSSVVLPITRYLKDIPWSDYIDATTVLDTLFGTIFGGIKVEGEDLGLVPFIEDYFVTPLLTGIKNINWANFAGLIIDAAEIAKSLLGVVFDFAVALGPFVQENILLPFATLISAPETWTTVGETLGKVAGIVLKLLGFTILYIADFAANDIILPLGQAIVDAIKNPEYVKNLISTGVDIALKIGEGMIMAIPNIVAGFIQGLMVEMGFAEKYMGPQDVEFTPINLDQEIWYKRYNALILAGMTPDEARIEAGPQPHAKGGPVLGGSPYIVGEQGMELFVPSQSGTIIPNTLTRKLLQTISSPGTLSDQIIRMMTSGTLQGYTQNKSNIYNPIFNASPSQEMQRANRSMYSDWITSSQRG